MQRQVEAQQLRRDKLTMEELQKRKWMAVELLQDWQAGQLLMSPTSGADTDTDITTMLSKLVAQVESLQNLSTQVKTTSPVRLTIPRHLLRSQTLKILHFCLNTLTRTYALSFEALFLQSFLGAFSSHILPVAHAMACRYRFWRRRRWGS